MIGNLKGKHDSIHTIRYEVYRPGPTDNWLKVVFNRDVAYYIDAKTLKIVDMEGVYDVDPRDLKLMRKVISDKIDF